VNIPGVRVLRAAGSVGSGGVTRVRGVGSLSLSSEPLIYVDGVRVNNDPSVVTEAFQRFSGESPSRVNDINPEEIESIEVIKGPSASTIYGTEASNGVIQIITKRGRPGRTQFEVHTSFGRSWVYDPEHRYQTNWYQNLGPDGLPDGTVTEFNVQEFNKARGYPPIFTFGYPKSLGASVSGGTDRLSYFFSADFDRDEGYVEYSRQNKYNARPTSPTEPPTTSSSWTRASARCASSSTVRRGSSRSPRRSSGPATTTPVAPIRTILRTLASTVPDMASRSIARRTTARSRHSTTSTGSPSA
jgi:TonB-dependent SusC/RagA subfamily outer membrane receptor